MESGILIAMFGLMGISLITVSYFSMLRNCSYGSSISLSGHRQRRLLHDTNANGNDSSLRSHGLNSFAVLMIPITQFKKLTESYKANHDTLSNECAICLGEYEDHEWVKTMPNCFHVFHVSCIDTWFKTSSSCPVCRSDVFNLEVSFCMGESLGINLIREDIDVER